MARKRKPVSIKKDGKIEIKGEFIEMSSGVQWNIPHAEKHLTMCEKDGEINIHTTQQSTGMHDKGIVGSELEGLRGQAIDINEFKAAHPDDKVRMEIRVAALGEQLMVAFGPMASETVKQEGVVIDVDETKARAKQVDLSKPISMIIVPVKDYEFEAVSAYTLLLIMSADEKSAWLLTYAEGKWYAADFSEKKFEAFRALWGPRVEPTGKFLDEAVSPSNQEDDKS